MNRYIGQLIHGCGDPGCDEQLCDTGRRNTSQAPVRRYNERSARAIAMTIMSGPRPGSRLCPRYVPDTTGAVMAVTAEPQRDHASFIQQLADTTMIREMNGSPSYQIGAQRLESSCAHEDNNSTTNIQSLKEMITCFRAMNYRWVQPVLHGCNILLVTETDAETPNVLFTLETLAEHIYTGACKKLTQTLARRCYSATEYCQILSRHMLKPDLITSRNTTSSYRSAVKPCFKILLINSGIDGLESCFCH